MSKNWHIPRRTFLRGMGTAIALPMFDAMLPAVSRAAEAETAAATTASATTAAAPMRTAYFYVPNGVHMEHWKPKADGTDFELPEILAPLEDLRGDINILTGLAHDKAKANGDGAGDHARSGAAFLTGCQPRKTDGADIKAGISVDQFAAQHVGKHTKFASLELGLERGRQAGNCDSGYSCAYSSNVSWRSESTPMAKEIDPRLVFERLFSVGSTQEVAGSVARRNRERKSILDFVSDDAKSLRKKLGRKDQRKLSEYLSGVREIEQRIAKSETRETITVAGVTAPAGIPKDLGEHYRLMCDMLVLAFQGDLTRISTFMVGNAGSNRSFPFIDVPEGHHSLSHHQNKPETLEKIKKINVFHMQQFEYFLKRLKSIEEGEGTLLDNCAIVYGSAIGDGNRHNHNDLPVLMAGKAGGTIQTGRHIVYEDDTPMNNLFLSLLDRQGVEVESLGDSSGRLKGLEG